MWLERDASKHLCGIQAKVIFDWEIRCGRVSAFVFEFLQVLHGSRASFSEYVCAKDWMPASRP